jgi:alkanesulfonate monooxygenase SsuD/methylene tetrahydromethanopterin reductase-like flavin-dependent oxidoreductase (luciferase family)
MSFPSGTPTLKVRFGFSTGVYPYGFPDGAWFGELCHRIEEWGFDDVACYVDRPTWRSPILDPVVLLSIAAATTRSAGLIGLVVLPQRVPLIVAKQLASISYIAGGRVVLALGVGGDYPNEMRACGVDPRERAPRLEEGMHILRGIWRGEPFSLAGRFQTLEEITQRPSPPAGPVPLWLAHRARSEASLTRTALHADGWMPSWVSPRRLKKAKARILSVAAQAGRDISHFEICQVVRMYLHGDEAKAADRVARFRAEAWGHPYEPELVRHLQAVGPPEVCRKRLAQLIAAGADRITIQAECPWPEFEDQIRLIRAEILDRREAILAEAARIAANGEDGGDEAG